jgi:hypothetical protein
LPVNYKSSLLDAWSELERQTESCQDAVNHIIALWPMRFPKAGPDIQQEVLLITLILLADIRAFFSLPFHFLHLCVEKLFTIYFIPNLLVYVAYPCTSMPGYLWNGAKLRLPKSVFNPDLIV